MFSDLERLNETWNRAWLEKDGAIVDRLMANEYVYIGPSGQVLDRQTILKIIQSANYRLFNEKRTEVLIKPVGKDAAASGARIEEFNPGRPQTLYTIPDARTSGAVVGDGDLVLTSIADEARPNDVRLILDWQALLKR